MKQEGCRITEDVNFSWNGRKKKCKRGHEFTEENTYYDKKGFRHCKTCMRDKSRLRYHGKTLI